MTQQVQVVMKISAQSHQPQDDPPGKDALCRDCDTAAQASKHIPMLYRPVNSLYLSERKNPTSGCFFFVQWGTCNHMVTSSFYHIPILLFLFLVPPFLPLLIHPANQVSLAAASASSSVWGDLTLPPSLSPSADVKLLYVPSHSKNHPFLQAQPSHTPLANTSHTPTRTFLHYSIKQYIYQVLHTHNLCHFLTGTC